MRFDSMTIERVCNFVSKELADTGMKLVYEFVGEDKVFIEFTTNRTKFVYEQGRMFNLYDYKEIEYYLLGIISMFDAMLTINKL